MSSYVPVADQIKEVEYWLRLATFLHYPLKNALLFVLHNTGNRTDYDGLPKDATKLYNKLSANINQINKLTKKKVLSKAQVDLLLPPKGNKTDSSTFDVTLIIVLIINFTTLPAPNKGWNVKLDPTDVSTAAFVILARLWRNRLIHATEPGSLCKTDFDNTWSEGEDIVKGLGLTTVNTNALKHIDLDDKKTLVMTAVLSYKIKIQGTLDGHDKKLAILQGDVTNVNNVMKTKIANTTSEVDKIKDEVLGHKEDIGLLKEQMESIQHNPTSTEVDEIKDEVLGNKEDIGLLKEQMESIQHNPTSTEVDEIKDEVLGNKEDIGLLKEQMESIQHNPISTTEHHGNKYFDEITLIYFN